MVMLNPCYGTTKYGVKLTEDEVKHLRELVENPWDYSFGDNELLYPNFPPRPFNLEFDFETFARKLTEGILAMNKPKIKNVIFNPPATIIFWEDKTKTVVKCQGDEPYDAEKGFVMAYMKKLLGNDNTFNKEIKKWVKYEPKFEVASMDLVEDPVDPNRPLTIEDLEKMDGQKVYVVSLDENRKEDMKFSYSGWRTVNVNHEKLYDDNDCYYRFDAMNGSFGYHAYREPPKGAK